MTDSGFIGGARRARRLTRRGFVLALVGAVGVTALLMVVCPLVGRDGLLDLGRIVDGYRGGPNEDWLIFSEARVPRLLAAAIVGAGLAAAGCAFQAVLRNPLAEPYTLGISSGSALAAVAAIRFGLERTWLGTNAIGMCALAGAGATVYIVWRLGRVGRSLPAATLLLAGITIAMFCSAATMLMQYTADFQEIGRMVQWMMGGLQDVEYGDLPRGSVAIAIGGGVLLARARDLNALAAGADAAASVGVNPMRSLTVVFVVSSLIVGAAISIAGPVGFIGLIIPHAMRGIVGPDHRVLLPTSMLCGAAMLVVCDTLARIALASNELPVGVVTALLGGPFFLYLLVREKGKGQLWGG